MADGDEIVPPPVQITYMDIEEFQRDGWLQEANRLFFHPLGLALEVSASTPDSNYDTLRIWDYREDEEGMLFAEGVLDPAKVATVDGERERHRSRREEILGHAGPQEPGDTFLA